MRGEKGGKERDKRARCGYGGGGKKKIRKENKVSGPIECGSGLSPDSCSVHYYVSKETDNSSYTRTHTHKHKRGSILPTNAFPSEGNETLQQDRIGVCACVCVRAADAVSREPSSSRPEIIAVTTGFTTNHAVDNHIEGHITLGLRVSPLL